MSLEFKEATVREIKKLMDILTKWGNVLVPGFGGVAQVSAQDKLQHCVNSLLAYGLSMDDIQELIDK